MNDQSIDVVDQKKVKEWLKKRKRVKIIARMIDDDLMNIIDGTY
jgi:hypothetical protein